MGSIPTRPNALAAEKFSRGKPRTDEKTGKVHAPAQYARSAATVNKYLRTLSRVFSLAVREWRLLRGASLLEIADLLGHRTLAMVKRYSHLVVDHKAKLIERLVAAEGL